MPEGSLLCPVIAVERLATGTKANARGPDTFSVFAGAEKARQSVRPSDRPRTRLSVRTPVRLSVRPFARQSVRPPVRQCICSLARPPARPPVRPPVRTLVRPPDRQLQ